jgi:hypothetical protein
MGIWVLVEVAVSTSVAMSGVADVISNDGLGEEFTGLTGKSPIEAKGVSTQLEQASTREPEKRCEVQANETRASCMAWRTIKTQGGSSIDSGKVKLGSKTAMNGSY